MPGEGAAQERNDLSRRDSRERFQGPLPASSEPGLGADSKFHAFCKNEHRLRSFQGLFPSPPPSSLKTRCKVWWRRRTHLGRKET